IHSALGATAGPWGGIALAVLVAVAALGVWRFLGRRLLRGRLIHYSTWRYEARSYRNPPDVELLARASDELGRPPASGDTRREYVARVFRLEDVDDPLNFDAETTDAWMAALRAGEYLTAYN